MDESSAAWNLFFMSHSKLDEKSAMALRRELKKRENNVVPSRVPPPVPRLFSGLIGQCSQPYEKKLTSSDKDLDLGRLLIGKQFAETSLKPLLNKDEDLGVGIPVTVYDLNGTEYKMMFKFWASKYYVLTQGWTSFCRGNDLDCEDLVVKLWMFRHVVTGGAGGLCFIIHLL